MKTRQFKLNKQQAETLHALWWRSVRLDQAQKKRLPVRDIAAAGEEVKALVLTAEKEHIAPLLVNSVMNLGLQKLYAAYELEYVLKRYARIEILR